MHDAAEELLSGFYLAGARGPPISESPLCDLADKSSINVIS